MTMRLRCRTLFVFLESERDAQGTMATTETRPVEGLTFFGFRCN